jgi:hypothetical protein
LSGAACSILQNVGQTLQKAAGEVSKVVAVPVRVVGRASDQFGDLITGAPNCQGSCSTYRTKGEADAAIAKLPTSPINVRACVKSICDKKFSSSPIPDQPMPSNAFASANFFRGKL